MCGIIGAVSRHAVQSDLLEALGRMEYRGYDSAGICVEQGGSLDCRKEAGKLVNLRTTLAASPLPGNAGIGHTRWATHGGPNRENAHPHMGAGVAVVHNGIIENHELLRRDLKAEGVEFRSQTDTEVIPWLLSQALREQGMDAAWADTVDRLEGAYAIVALHAGDGERMWFARRGSPLLLGRSADAVYAASDALALAGLADEVMSIEEGDIGCIGL
ncbi:MAG: glutamine--fructose-6-phosphate aminotransferase, partial [Mariprofundaceae bacterium]|nr:glutamine--fructose-6-phosphate aminotransferase [Mariprofundaceae bacterium]